MATNYEKILTSIGSLYRNTDRSNKQERLRLLSTVALHAPNETLKRFFQRRSKKDDLVSVNEAEIVQAREYAKQFGPGTHVMPVGQVSWRDIIANNHAKPTVSLPANEDSTITNANLQLSQDSSLQDHLERQISKSADEESQDKVTPSENQNQNESDKAEYFESGFPGGNVDEEAEKKKAVVNGLDKATKISSAPLSQKVGQVRRNVAKKRRRTISNVSDKARNNTKDEPTIKKRKKLSLDGAVTEKLKKKQEGSKSSLEKEGTSEIKEKRKRTAFSNEKKDILERHFQKSIYATKSMVLEISQEVGLDKKKIDNWFRNRRSKLKKDELDKKLKEAAAAQNKLGSSLSESRNASELDYSSGMSSEETNYEDTPEKTVENNENLEDSGGKNMSELVAPEVPMDSESSKGLNASGVLEKEKSPEIGQLEEAVQSVTSIQTDIPPEVVSSATYPRNKEGCGTEESEEKGPMDSKQLNSAEKPADDDSVRAEGGNSSGSNKQVTPEIPATVSASVDIPDASLVGKTFYDDSADDCSVDSGEGSLVIAENSDPDSETDEAEDTAPVKMLPKFNFEQIDSSEKPLLM